MVGVFLFALATLVHFLFVVVERSRDAERRGLEREVHAREAELKALKAQLDPHFLFNSLNSVSALIGSDPPAARRMCYLMAGFFRKSLGLGQKESIPLAEEIYLAETYLAIEEVRFGARLRTRFHVAEETLTLRRAAARAAAADRERGASRHRPPRRRRRGDDRRRAAWASISSW